MYWENALPSQSAQRPTHRRVKVKWTTQRLLPMFQALPLQLWPRPQSQWIILTRLPLLNSSPVTLEGGPKTFHQELSRGNHFTLTDHGILSIFLLLNRILTYDLSYKFFLQPPTHYFTKWFPFHNNFRPSLFRIHSFEMHVPCQLFFVCTVHDVSLYKGWSKQNLGPI